MADSAGDPVVGATLAGYRIERKLGRGGMSVVYLAEDLALGRKVALKVLAPELSEDPGFRERFRLESRLAASIDHPNVIPIFEAGEAEGQLYIAMRYVEGVDLRRLIDEEGALEPGRAVGLVARAAEGLQAAHERGLVHRDVKPSNVLIADPGAGEHVYLADFGLTKTVASEEAAREAAQLSGTSDYVAPELITEGGAGMAADVYALGCVLYEALTGSVPFPRGSELETLVAHIDEPVPRPSAACPQLPSALDSVVERAMAKDPGERYGSAAELAAAARAALPSAGRPRRLALPLAAVAALLAGSALAAVFLTRSNAPGPYAPTTDLAETGAVQRVDPETGRLEATVRVAGQPLDLETGSGALWLADDDRDVVHRIDPETYGMDVAAATPTRGAQVVPTTLVAAGDEVWLGAGGREGQSLIVPVTQGAAASSKTLDLTALARGGGDLSPPVFAPTQLIPERSAWPGGEFSGWVVNAFEGSLRRFQPGRYPAVSKPIPTGGTPHVAAAAEDGAVWVGQDQELLEVAPSGAIVARLRLPGTAVALAAGTAGVWVATLERSLVMLVSDRKIAHTIRTRGQPVDLEVADNSLWILHRDGLLTKLDPATGDTLTSERVGTNAVALAAGLDSVWVAVRGGRQLVRSSLPTRLGLVGYFPLSAVPDQCGAVLEDCNTAFGQSMVAPAGEYGGYFRERRVAGGEARCRGTTYNGLAVSDVRNAGRGSIRLQKWGTLAIHFARMVVVADGVQGWPICNVGTGPWIATAGPLKGERGTFTFLGPLPESIILD